MIAPGRFLGRWSRLKRQAESAPAAPAATETGALPGEAAAVPADPPASPAGEAAPEAGLPPVDALGLDSDFTAFLKKEVSESLRRAALHKLFSDPHFNRMDGLDVYIDDYSIPDPIPPDMLARLRQAQTLLYDQTAAATDEAAETLAPPLPEAAAAADVPAAPEAPSAGAGATEPTAAAAPATDPAIADPAITDPAITDPAITDPTATDLAAAHAGVVPPSPECDTLGRAGQKVPGRPN
jgi:hypothetical protein